MRELSDFDEMYQEVIIDHYKNPRNKTKLTNFTNETLSHNPFCGDEIELQLLIENGVISNVSVDRSIRVLILEIFKTRTTTFQIEFPTNGQH